MKRLLVLLLRAYQLLLSPMLGQRCRFYPSCSHYAVEAIQTHGAARGSWLTVRRLGKCHPWHAGGLDPVPPKADAHAACACHH
jgi:putative membrane protein insertion efficiency factor